MNACYKCQDRHIWYDSDGKAHTCHETCERHAKDKVEREMINQKIKEDHIADSTTATAIKHVFGAYRWNKKGER